MTDRSIIRVVLPAYNERSNLIRLIPRWKEVLAGVDRPWEIIVVNDGSTDGTAELLSELGGELPLTVLTHEVNQGLGPTLRDGLIKATEAAGPDDLVVTMDADCTHPPELIPKMLSKLEAESLDVVIASRYRSGARVVGLSRLRRLTGAGARMLMQMVFPLGGVRDYTCGFRLYRAGCIQQALRMYGARFCRERSFACMAEVLLEVARSKARFGEVPLTLHYDAKAGRSKMRVVPTILRTLGLMVRLKLSRPPERRDNARS